MFTNFTRSALTTAFALVACAGAAQADTLTTYSSQAAFLAATNGGAGLGFENYNSVADGTGSNTRSYTAGGTTMTADTVGSASASPQAVLVAGPAYGLPTNHLFSNFATSALRLTFNQGITAFGSDMWSWAGANIFSISVTDSSSVVHNYLVNVPAAPGGFFGFTVSGGSILQIVINSTTNGWEGIDNTYWGSSNVSVVPLPPAVLAGLGGLASVGIVGAIRRRRVAK